MKNEIRDFLSNIKYEYFCFLKNNARFFPKCCVDSTLILKYFIKEYFGEDYDIIKASKKHFNNKAKFHIWLEKDDFIIDFTLFQFYVGANKFKKISDEESYDYCIDEIQRGDIVFSKEYYQKMFLDYEDPDVNWFLQQYNKSPWEKTIDLSIPPKESFLKYLSECEEIVK